MTDELKAHLGRIMYHKYILHEDGVLQYSYTVFERDRCEPLPAKQSFKTVQQLQDAKPKILQDLIAQRRRAIWLSCEEFATPDVE